MPDFLEKFPAADFQADEDALQEFKDHIRPYLGSDLVDNYDAVLGAKDDEGFLHPADAPLLNLAIAETRKGQYILVKCSPLA